MPTDDDRQSGLRALCRKSKTQRLTRPALITCRQSTSRRRRQTLAACTRCGQRSCVTRPMTRGQGSPAARCPSRLLRAGPRPDGWICQAHSCSGPQSSRPRTRHRSSSSSVGEAVFAKRSCRTNDGCLAAAAVGQLHSNLARAGAAVALVVHDRRRLGVRPKSAFHTSKGRRTPFKQTARRGDSVAEDFSAAPLETMLLRLSCVRPAGRRERPRLRWTATRRSLYLI